MRNELSRVIRSFLGIALLVAAPATASAQGERYAVVVQGASGEEQYATLHRQWVDSLTKILVERFKIDKTHVSVLTEQPRTGEERATAENVKTVLGRLAGQVKAADLLFVLLIGHGGGEGADAKFNLIGPDLGVADWAALLKPIPGRVAVVDSTSSSFAYLKGLAAPGRVVMTATNSFSQRYHTVFPDAFVRALTANDADVDKNGRISLLEAFNHASRLVTQHYEQSGHLATERAVFDDTGDGVGRDAAGTGPDGTIAGLTYLDTVAMPTSSDPAVQEMLGRQKALTEQVDELRRKRPTMAADEFDREFEKLIVELALVSRDVRRKMGG
ncbi:MAG TPA: hypothetical protein VES67_09345 [Vicinamibacterales bacterium]|nr:hypothetical protein [Vicinamibacterales bacterium]